MTMAEVYHNEPEPEGGVILWSDDLDAAPDRDAFLVKVKIESDQSKRHRVAIARKMPDGIEHSLHGLGNPVAWVRCPDPESQVAYQLGDPGEGTGSTRGPGEGTGV